MKIFFDHIQKTGGTSLRKFFCQAFGEEKVSPQLIGHSPRSSILLYRDCTVINGHFSYNPVEDLPSDCVTLTILREPLARTISRYCALRDSPESGLSANTNIIRKRELADLVVNSHFKMFFSNAQAKHFASLCHYSPQNLPPDELLEFAMKGLDKYDLVGTTERLSDFADILRDIFGFSEDCVLRRENVTLRGIKFSDLDEEAQSIITTHNQVDLELWRYANRLFDSKSKNFVLAENTAISISSAGGADRRDADKSHALQVSTYEGSGVEFLDVSVVGAIRNGAELMSGSMAAMSIYFRALVDIDDLTLGYSIEHESGLHIFGVSNVNVDKEISCRPGEYYIKVTFSANLAPGSYYVSIVASAKANNVLVGSFFAKNAASFAVFGFLSFPFSGLVRLAPTFSCGSHQGLGHIEVKSDPPLKSLGRAGRPVQDARGFLKTCETATMRVDEYISIPVEIHNQGDDDWYGDGDLPCCISYHWKDMNEETILHDGIRTPMPGSVHPGCWLAAVAAVQGPERLGQYLLEITLVQDGVCWFEQAQFKSALVRVEVVLGA